MKNVFKNLMIYGAVASMAFLYSCGGDEETPAPATPTIAVATTVNGTAATSPLNVVPGDEVVFNVSINAEGGFNVYRVFVSKDGGAATKLAEYTRLDLSVDAGVAVVTDSRATEIEAEDVGSTITFEFEVVDDKDQTSTTEVEVVVNSPEARIYASKKLLAPSGDFTNENFFSVSTGELYSKSEVNSTTESISPLIDFGYYYGNSENASIASPKGFESTVFASQVEGWNTKNETELKTTTLTGSQFNEVSTYADIDAAFDAGTLDANGVITGLTEGTVLAFKTVEGVKGLILVSKIEPGFESNDYIELDILAQLEAN
ncbi:hypothetical protein [Marinoscillum sp.]|uniref:hypothetical protein n=1 Tax=Marinoscillum sp. TaxID=2024838 RepID=UPI003BA98FE7